MEIMHLIAIGSTVMAFVSIGIAIITYYNKQRTDSIF